MKVVLSVYRRQIVYAFAAAVLISGIALLAAGEITLMGGVAAGAAAAALYFWQLAQRLMRAARLRAVGQVQMGMILMFVLVAAVTFAAVRTSVLHFFAMLGGFLLVHAVMMVQMIVHAIRSDKEQSGEFPQGR